MRKIIIALCMLPCTVIAQNKFTIQGKVEQLNVPAKAYLQYNSGVARVVDSALVNNGTFMFIGVMSGISQAQIIIKHEVTVKDPDKIAKPDLFTFYLEPKILMLNSITDSVKYAIIKDSKVNDDNERYKALTKSVRKKNEALVAEFKSKGIDQQKEEAYMKTVFTRSEAIKKESAEINKQFYITHLDSYVGLVAYSNELIGEIDPVITQSEFNKFSVDLRSTDLGKTIADKIALAKHTGIGSMAIDFTQNDVNDKPVKLSAFKGSYVLLDFWASWCVPCRAENPNLVKAYNKYKDRNFTILGVSLDQPGKKELWLKAIEKDGLVWTQVSDLKFWNNEVANKYGIKAVPQNYLIDPTGKIIAKNLYGEALLAKLASLFNK